MNIRLILSSPFPDWRPSCQVTNPKFFAWITIILGYLPLDPVTIPFDYGTQIHPHCKTGEGQAHWVLCVKWSHDSDMLASGGMDSVVCIWDRNLKCTIPSQGTHQMDHFTGLGTKGILVPCLLVVLRIPRPEYGMLVRGNVSLFCHSTPTPSPVSNGQPTDGSSPPPVTEQSKCGIAQGNLLKTLSGHAHWINCIALSDEHPAKQCSHFDLFLGQKTPPSYYGRTLIQSPFIPTNWTSSHHQWHPLFTKFPILCKCILWQIHQALEWPNWAIHLFISWTCWSNLSTFMVLDSRSIASCSKDFTVKVWSIQTKKIANNLVGTFRWSLLCALGRFVCR